MKTLDEVITHLSTMDKDDRCMYCPFDREENGYLTCTLSTCVYDDALHYLKMYRSDQIQWEADRKLWVDKQKQVDEARQKYIDKLKELEIGTLNDPLTWDELKGMEGKPVWVELTYPGYQPWCGWEVIDHDGVDGKWMSTYRDDYNREQMGKTWQAYRKERE